MYYEKDNQIFTSEQVKQAHPHVSFCGSTYAELGYAQHTPPQPPAPDPQLAINAEARSYLAQTDWYAIRFAETGTLIPADIVIARQAARDSIVEPTPQTEPVEP